MSASNKRCFNDDLYRQSVIDSISSSKKRHCISLVPTVPRGGSDYLQKFRRMSSDVNLSPQEKKVLDAGDRVINKK